MSAQCRYCELLPMVDCAGEVFDYGWVCKLSGLMTSPGASCHAAPWVRSGDGTCFGTASAEAASGDAEAWYGSVTPMVEGAEAVPAQLVLWAGEWLRKRGALPPL